MAKLGYFSVGSNRLAEAKRFYDALLETVGMGVLFDEPSGSRAYGSFDRYVFSVMSPHDGREATVGNGSMCGFALDSREAVAAFHAKAIDLGGISEGEPGLRGPEEIGAYFAYVHDLDGNKLCAYNFG